jgi:hypothetical protein
MARPGGRTNLVLVESRRDVLRHLKTRPREEDTRFLTFDWPTLDGLKRDGWAAYPLESFIPRDVGLKYQERMEEQIRNWHIVDGCDVSACRGVSLAAPFSLELHQYFAYAYRYGIAFCRALYQLDPDVVTACLLPRDHPYLEYAVKREVIDAVARSFGRPLVRRESKGPVEIRRLPEMVHRDIFRLTPGRRAFFRLVGLAGRVRGLFGAGRPEILFHPEGIFFTPLFERYLERRRALGFRPVFPVMSHPPRSLALRMIRAGSIPFFPLCTDRRGEVGRASRRIRRDLRAMMETAAWRARWTIEGVDFSAVFTKIIEDVVLRDIEATARFAEACRREFRRRPIVSVVVPNDRARVARVLLETAREEGVETVYFEHGLTKYRPLIVPPGGKWTIDRLIVWGERDRRALAGAGAAGVDVSVFTPPFLARYLPRRPRHTGEPRKVLVLEHCYTKDHVNGVAHAGEEFLIRLTEGLRALGVREIRFKVHPGMTIRSYFVRLVRERGLDVSVYKDEDLRSLILWSDLVIGPISTAVLEVLLLGRDYYCVDLEGLAWEGSSVFDGGALRIHPSVEDALNAVCFRDPAVAAAEDPVESVCGVGPGTGPRDVLDPLLDDLSARAAARSPARTRLSLEAV